MAITTKSLMLKHFGTDHYKEAKILSKEPVDNYFKRRPDEEVVKIPLPYYAPIDGLPPIPTPEDVEKSKSATNPRYGTLGCLVFQINKVYAVKVSARQNILSEAENLIFLQEHEVRTPRVYAVWVHQGARPYGHVGKAITDEERSKLPKYYYLVMEWIEGVQLHKQWEGFSLQAKIKVWDKIGEQIRLLRSIPPPNPNYYGRVNEQPFNDLNFLVHYRNRPSGPFYTYESFLQQVYNSLEYHLLCALCGGAEPEELEFQHHFFLSNFFDCLEAPSKSSEPRLTHFDAKSENIMLVPPASGTPVEYEDYDVVLLDWEYLCWAPAWAEIASVSNRMPLWVTEKQGKARDDEFWAGLHYQCKGMQPNYYAQGRYYADCASALYNPF